MNKNSGEQEKETIILVRGGYKNQSLGITICHHLASLVMPNRDPRDEFFQAFPHTHCRSLKYTIYINVDLAHYDIFHAKVGKGGINGVNLFRYNQQL